MAEYKSINVKPETWVDLNKLGMRGESFDDIIQRLINCCKDKEKSEKLEKI